METVPNLSPILPYLLRERKGFEMEYPEGAPLHQEEWETIAAVCLSCGKRVEMRVPRERRSPNTVYWECLECQSGKWISQWYRR